MYACIDEVITVGVRLVLTATGRLGQRDTGSVFSEEVLTQQKDGRLAHAVDGTRCGTVLALSGVARRHARGGEVPCACGLHVVSRENLQKVELTGVLLLPVRLQSARVAAPLPNGADSQWLSSVLLVSPDSVALAELLHVARHGSALPPLVVLCVGL